MLWLITKLIYFQWFWMKYTTDIQTAINYYGLKSHHIVERIILVQFQRKIKNKGIQSYDHLGYLLSFIME